MILKGFLIGLGIILSFVAALIMALILGLVGIMFSTIAEYIDYNIIQKIKKK